MTELAKSGWLMRESSILKRWKKSWFSLSVDGYLRYFESPNNQIAENTIHVPREVIAIITGVDVEGVKPPENNSKENLIKLITREGYWLLCAEDVDDMLAWQLALEQARVVNQPRTRHENLVLPSYLNEILIENPNNGYPMYFRGDVYNGRYPTRIVHTPQGPITVVYIQDPYYRYDSGADAALGILAGTALVTALMIPFWFPLFLI